MSFRDEGMLATAPTGSRVLESIGLVLEAEPWREDALCAQTDPDAFFPESGDNTDRAKAICARCTVVEDCLAYALRNDEQQGIWGGLSARQRRTLQSGVAA